MCSETQLSNKEWDLIVELLERERAELPVEIHHTRTSSVREDLRERAEIFREQWQRNSVVAGGLR